MRIGVREGASVILVATLAACGSTKLKALQCPAGQHDGGKGRCVPSGTCADGYYADGSGACQAPVATAGVTDEFLSPARMSLDLVFMIDNSDLAAKVDKMSKQLTKLFQALKDPADGSLPDLRVAVIDSDLGTGCSFSSGSCGPKVPPSDGCFGDQGKFQMRKSPTACQFDDGAQFLEVKNNQPVNFTGPVDNLNNVLACLFSNLFSTFGNCGYEHVLQAFEFALAAKGVGTEEQQVAFLRPNALLGLVFITDEDDCSAATNYGMFRPLLPGESASLRCATRGHACGDRNLTDTPPGYPTIGPFTHPFADCVARADACPNPTDGTGETDTSVPTACSPLKSVKHLADEIKALKAEPDKQIFVAGIFGWPRSDTDMATAVYKIAPLPNPNTADPDHPTVFDHWPVCYDPDHMPSAATTDPATGFDSVAAGWGAMGGLRNAAFVDEFGENGLKLSICERDFTAGMTAIGSRLAQLASDVCFDVKLLDTDAATPGVQPDCQIYWRKPLFDEYGSEGYYESPASLPACAAGATDGNVPEDCWRFVDDPVKCPANGQRLEVLRTAAELAQLPKLVAGTKLRAHCRTCADSTSPGCVY